MTVSNECWNLGVQFVDFECLKLSFALNRVIVERILNTSLVPYSLEPAERMKRLYELYCNLDERAVRYVMYC